MTLSARLAAAAFVWRSPLLLLCLAPLVPAALAPPPPTLPGLPLDLCLGALAVALGTGLRLWAVRAIGKRARVRRARAERLLVTGPYARLRNPLYVANTAIALGLSWSLGGWQVGLLVGGLVVLVYELVIRHEEAALGASWGEEYRAYLAAVPRWRPLLRPAAERDAPPPWAWGEVLRRELALVLGIPLALAAALAVRAGWLPLASVLSPLAGLTHLPPWAPPLLALLAAALGQGAVTEAKRRRHERQRAALAAAGEVPAIAPLG